MTAFNHFRWDGVCEPCEDCQGSLTYDQKRLAYRDMCHVLLEGYGYTADAPWQRSFTKLGAALGRGPGREESTVRASVVHRPNTSRGTITKADYAEVIAELTDAMNSVDDYGLPVDGARGCAVCHDSHLSHECHHNALVLARRYVKIRDVAALWHEQLHEHGL